MGAHLWFHVYFVHGEQGIAVRVEFGDSTTCADPSSANVISRAFPHTFGQPLAHFLRATAKVPDAQIITEHPPMRFVNMSCPLVVPCEQVNSQLISNVCIDAQSAEKVYLFTISEKYHGVVLIPEGLVESIPELYALLQVLGHICYHILAAGLNGYMATATNLKHPVNKWRCGAAPLTAMMTVKRYTRGPGAVPVGKPAIHPATVDLKGKVYEYVSRSHLDGFEFYLLNVVQLSRFRLLRQKAPSFLMDDLYRNPGPLQFEGPGADAKTYTLAVEDQDYMGRMKKLQEYLDKVHVMITFASFFVYVQVKSIVKPGCSQEVVKAALSSMASVTEVLSVMTTPSFGGHQPL
ncbi:hypothetical protein BHE74_00007500 [Ensete ventricosum]|nr:hypothetical protein BHE74_00007500 [Ensete ventricosum]